LGSDEVETIPIEKIFRINTHRNIDVIYYLLKNIGFDRLRMKSKNIQIK